MGLILRLARRMKAPVLELVAAFLFLFLFFPMSTKRTVEIQREKNTIEVVYT